MRATRPASVPIISRALWLRPASHTAICWSAARICFSARATASSSSIHAFPATVSTSTAFSSPWGCLCIKLGRLGVHLFPLFFYRPAIDVIVVAHQLIDDAVRRQFDDAVGHSLRQLVVARGKQDATPEIDHA